ncbi:presenilin family intramembrane aspartyl protease PSH [Haloarcula onubensis]|uniref:Presenilin family intramembrane aspartyl protease n=1 Tax=Haloarcula onubensis TaxID=2950539 RepID=A0ABU2FL85_9EURY|nr:presenilin family intramembrane aspartyl protease PSH [Halomicroarcula sp. S3CR25-11]MDS0281521.1 presenilin family intramembrane aspartyl protease [Halomicroarcula sp. S3CR25-11]
MDRRWRVAAGCSLIAAIFLFVQVGALALVEPFKSAGYQAVEDPSDPTNSVVYVGAILVATAGMLLAFKYDADQLIRGVIVFSSAWLSLYIFRLVAPPLLVVGGFNVLALALATGLGVGLLVYPEWYVIDTAGAVMGAAAAGLFGISFGILPALLLLSVLAVYDAISVYGTEHMLTLASGVMDLRVPVVLVIPLSLSYSFLDATTPDPTADEEGDGETAQDDAGGNGETAADGEPADGGEAAEDEMTQGPLERDALFIGLGDAIIPAILVASAAFFAPASVRTVLGVPLPAVTAGVGTFVGLAVLLWMVLKGRAHAGLPLLNGGTIAGYLLGAVAAGIGLVEALGLAPYV